MKRRASLTARPYGWLRAPPPRLRCCRPRTGPAPPPPLLLLLLLPAAALPFPLPFPLAARVAARESGFVAFFFLFAMRSSRLMSSDARMDDMVLCSVDWLVVWRDERESDAAAPRAHTERHSRTCRRSCFVLCCVVLGCFGGGGDLVDHTTVALYRLNILYKGATTELDTFLHYQLSHVQ